MRGAKLTGESTSDSKTNDAVESDDDDLMLEFEPSLADLDFAVALLEPFLRSNFALSTHVHKRPSSPRGASI